MPSSLQHLAILSAVSAHNGFNKSRTVFYHQPTNHTNYDDNMNFQNVNVFVGGAALSCIISVMCIMCYCFNRSINKNSMAVYRRHLFEINQNMDIYTIEQFYERESHMALYTSSNVNNLPPSYEDVMAAEKDYPKQCEGDRETLQLEEPVESNEASATFGSLVIGHITDTDNKADTNNGNSHGVCSNVNQLSELDSANGNKQSGNSTKSCCCVDNCRANSLSGHPLSDNNNNKAIQPTLQCAPSCSNDVNSNKCDGADCEQLLKCPCELCHSAAKISDEFDVLSDNGLIRIDMSKIIDQTGLPTYDAAIKLESFGYV